MDIQRAAGLQSGFSVITGSDPAANAEGLITVPAGKYYEVLLATLVVVQGITQTPQPLLQIDDGSTVLWEGFGSSAAQAVSTTCRYSWAPGLTLTGQVGATTGVRSNAPLPEKLILGPGFRVQTVTIGKGANTDLAAPVLYVAEYGR